MDQALKAASDGEKRIILVFQGSDWCAPCMKLDREIWSQDSFIEYANEHYIMVKADFPRKKANALPAEQQEKNNAMAEKYNEHGYFPFVVVLDKDGKILGETSYLHRSVEDYIALIDAF